MVATTERWFLALLLIVACKPSRRAESPPLDGGALADVERALTMAESDLRDAGVQVAYRSREAKDVARDARSVAVPPPADPDRAVPTPSEPPPPETEEGPPVAEPPPAPAERTETAPAAVEPQRRSNLFEEWIARRRATKAARSRCERVCSLAAATCDLRDRICDLASDHPDDARYDDACMRAEDQCVAARSYCDSCGA